MPTNVYVSRGTRTQKLWNELSREEESPTHSTILELRKQVIFHSTGAGDKVTINDTTDAKRSIITCNPLPAHFSKQATANSYLSRLFLISYHSIGEKQ